MKFSLGSALRKVYLRKQEPLRVPHADLACSVHKVRGKGYGKCAPVEKRKDHKSAWSAETKIG